MGGLLDFLRTRRKTGSGTSEQDKRKNEKTNLFTITQSSSFVSEQFRIIRAILLRTVKEKNVRTILVTSALPREGKTFVSSNLAVSIAQDVPDQVVLIDCDLRSPSLHKVFGLTGEEPGLSKYLSNGGRVPDVLHKTVLSNLSVIPTGPPPENVEGLLSVERIRHLIDALHSLHGPCYVIIDSGPVQLLADSLVMAELVDGIVVVVRVGETKKNLVKKTVDILGKDKILGVVLNYCDLPSKVYHRYYRYKKGTYPAK